MRRRRVPLILLGVLLLPTALASSQGAIWTDGPVRFIGGGDFAFDPVAVFGDDTSRVSEFSITAPRVVLHVFEQRTVQVGLTILPVYKDSASFPLTDVQMSLVNGDHRGWIGVYPTAGRTHVDIHSPIPTVLAPRAVSSMGNLVNPEDTPSPGVPGYGLHVARPHIYLKTSGDVTVQGAALVKVMGLDLIIHARENVTAHATGETRTTDGVTTDRVRSWVAIEFTDGFVAIRTDAPMAFATRGAEVAWSGATSLVAGGGELLDSGRRYPATGPVTFRGEFAGSITSVDEQAEAVAYFVFEGALASSSLGSGVRVVPSAPGGLWGGWIPIALIAAIAGGIGVAATLFHRRREPITSQNLSLEECVEMADRAAEEQRFQVALEWVQRARPMARGSARIMLDEGFYRGATGDVEGAILCYEEASAVAVDGEPEFLAANLILSSGGDLALAEDYVVRALTRSPAIAWEIEGEAAFQVLAGRPKFDRALRAAYRQFGSP